jgi:hypothetical protein
MQYRVAEENHRVPLSLTRTFVLFSGETSKCGDILSTFAFYLADLNRYSRASMARLRASGSRNNRW